MLSDIDFDDTNKKFPHSESETIELKESINFKLLEKYRETLCGFLNGMGGNLIFGIKNNLDIVGIKTNNNDLDKFICDTDMIVSNGLILCRDITKEDKVMTNISPNSIKVKTLINTSQQKFVIITATREPDPNVEYQMKCGKIIRRLNASNYYVKNERFYKEHELNMAVGKLETKLRTLHNENVQIIKKTLQEKDDEIKKLNDENERLKTQLSEIKKLNDENERLKTQLSEANNNVTDYEQYLINPLMDKLNKQTYSNYVYDFFMY